MNYYNNKRYQLLFILTLFVSGCSKGQQYFLKATIKNLPEKKILLARIYGDNYYVIDSAVSANDVFKFTLPNNTKAGVYKLILGRTQRAQFMGGPPQMLDIIFNNENIEFMTDFFTPVDSMKIIASKENQIYFDFIKRHNINEIEKQLLYPLLLHYPEKDDLFNEVLEKFNNIQTEELASINSITKLNKNSFAARIINMHRAPHLEATKTESQRLKHIREHYFDGLDFSDESLLRSSIYADNIIGYLSLYRNQNLHQSDQEDEFIKAVDVILEKTNQNQEVYAFILDYLVRGYERFKYEKVLNHIANNYLSTNCETENKTLLNKRLEAYKKMALGNTALDIVIEDINGEYIALSEIGTEYVLVLFWASWCPHCTSMLPELKKWYEKDRETDIEVLAVSIDTNRVEWEKSVISEELPWLNCSNLQGWAGTAARDYNLYATPTMFILDRNRTILAKPVTLAEFIKEVTKLKRN